MTPKGIRIFDRKPNDLPRTRKQFQDEENEAPAPASHDNKQLQSISALLTDKAKQGQVPPLTDAQQAANKQVQNAKERAMATGKALREAMAKKAQGTKAALKQIDQAGEFGNAPQAAQDGPQSDEQGQGEGQGGGQPADHFTEAVRQVLTQDKMASEAWTEHKLEQVQAEFDATRTALEEAMAKQAEEAAKPVVVEEPQYRFIKIQVNEQAPIDFEGEVHPLFEEVTRRLAARIDVALVGPTGCGKTYLMTQAAKAVGLRFGSISWSAGVTESAILGRRLPGKDGAFEFVSTLFLDFFENGGVWLHDEFDGADANVIMNLNSAQANGFLPVPNRVENPVAYRHKDFVQAAAMNTYGQGADRLYVGRNQLDAATLDRYSCNILDMDYDEKLEAKLVSEVVFKRFTKARKNAQANKLRRPISTRAMVNADKLLSAGFTIDQVWARYTAGWTADELTKIGA